MRALYGRFVSVSPFGFTETSCATSVLRFGRAHKPFVKPADDVFETFDPVPRLPGARELVGFARKLHHHCRHFEKLKGAKHFLAARPGWSARITFAEHEHHWRLHVLNISDGRPRLEIVGIIKGRRL